nr:acetate uptake transporter [Geovibrio thiophilus]
MDYTRLETGPLSFAGWTVSIRRGRGTVTDFHGNSVADFSVTHDGGIVLEHGSAKYADMALIALRSYVRERAISALTQRETAIRDTTANPAPLGLMGFGLTTILLNLHNIGLFGLGSMIISMGLFYGGAAQIIAGMMEWKKKNTFGTVAFISYGFFWITLVGMLTFPKFGFTEAPDATALSSFLFFWGFFTLILFIGTFRISRALTVVFFLLTLLFFMLGAADMLENPALKTAAGFVGILCGLAAVYTGAAQMLGEIYGKEILPLGEFK